MVDRLIGEETASNLAKVVQRPLLIASPSLARLPERLVIALDLDRSNRTDLLSTLELLGSPESVSVLHVKPRSESFGIDWAEYDDDYRADLAAGYAELLTSLETLPRIRADLVIEHGEVAREITRFAERSNAEMIVLGLKHRSPFSIAPGGGIAMKVARSTHCSVLLIPRLS